MPDIKFACPNCQQHIQAESGYAGMQIACPTCHAAMVVPGTPVARAPAPMAAAPPPPPPAPAAANSCPSCGASLPRGTALCRQCGYNLTTGQRMVAGRPAPLGKPGAPKWETPWYKTAYPYVGGILVVLGILYFLGKQNPAMMPAFILVAALYSVDRDLDENRMRG